MIATLSLLEEIDCLPEDSEAEALVPLFLSAMKEVRTIDAFEALAALADKQWHTYEKLDHVLASRLESWLLRCWSRASVHQAELLAFIVVNLGLENVSASIQKELARLPTEVQKELRTFLDEAGPTIADPYSGISDFSDERKRAFFLFL